MARLTSSECGRSGTPRPRSPRVDPDAHLSSPVLHHVDIPQETCDDAKKSLCAVLAEHALRVVALLRPLANHWILRERILTEDVLESQAS